MDDIGGGWAYGKPLETYDNLPEPQITTWTRGKTEELVWYVGPNHWGGYQARICKLPENGQYEHKVHNLNKRAVDDFRPH